MKTLIPWRRTNELPSLFRHEVDDLFDRFFGIGEVGNGATKMWAPPVDVTELDKEIKIKVDLPGVDPKDVEVYIANGALILKGEKKEEKEEKTKAFYRTERFIGAFYREVPLPVGFDPEKITATHAKGVLTVVIPKKPEMLPRKVLVKALE